MRLYLDQMIHGNVTIGLRERGYDVIHVADIGLSRADDSEILEKARLDNRILITMDHHFGDWAILPLNVQHPGVIRLRIHSSMHKEIVDLLHSFLGKRKGDELSNRLVILSQNNIRWIATRQA